MYKAIIKKSQAPHEILDYVPRQIDRNDHSVVENIVSTARESLFQDFKVAEVIKDFTGLSEVQSSETERKIEEKTLERLKEIEESAYNEAYKLGLDEGRKEAFRVASEEIKQQMDSLDQVIQAVQLMKPQILAFNESHLMKMVYHLASRIAIFEVERNDQAILHVLKEAIKMAQGEEKIRVLVNEKEVEYLEIIQKQNQRDLEFLKTVELKGQSDIKPGGCVIVTNYGEVDSRIEARVEQLWNAIKDTIPQSKDVVGL